MHLPTLDIRVEQKGNRARKWEIHVGFLLKPVYISGLSVLRRGHIRFSSEWYEKIFLRGVANLVSTALGQK